MKIKFNTNLLVNLVIISLILFGVANWVGMYFFLGSGKTYHGVDTMARYKWIDTLKPIDITVPDSLSHANYIKLEDSLKTSRKIKNLEFPGADGARFGGLMSMSSGLYCNNCTVKQFNDVLFSGRGNKQQIRYFIDLLGWTINNSTWAVEDDSVQFHVEDGKYYVRKAIIYPKQKLFKVIDEPVKFKYATHEQSIMIPVSKATRDTLNIILLIFVISFALYFFYLISAFLKFILDLSKGLSFTLKNVRRLKLIALSLIIWPFAELFLNYLFKIIFHSYFTNDVVFNWEKWRDNWKMIAVGLIFLALYRAFRQGKKLKDEQEFTI